MPLAGKVRRGQTTSNGIPPLVEMRRRDPKYNQHKEVIELPLLGPMILPQEG